MNLVYGFEARVSKRLLPYVHLIVEIMSEWPEKTECLKRVVDKYGGAFMLKWFYCCPEKLCDLCKEFPKKADRKNIHEFHNAFFGKFCKLPFRCQLDLVKFVDCYKSALFTKQGPITSLPPFMRISSS